MDKKVKIVIVAGLAVVSFAAGRYSVPTQVKEETKTTEQKNTTSDKQVNLNKHKVTTTDKKANGDQVTTIVEDDTYDSDKKTNISDNKTSDQVKEVTKQGGTLNISGLVVRDPRTGGLNYGGAFTKDILGPINAGAMCLTDGTFGVSLGVRF